MISSPILTCLTDMDLQEEGMENPTVNSQTDSLRLAIFNITSEELRRGDKDDVIVDLINKIADVNLPGFCY